MELTLPTAGLEHYKSASQRTRVATEAWAKSNLYCVNCPSPRLRSSPTNTAAIDYICPRCDSPFQLKAQSRPFSERLTDAAFEPTRQAIRSAEHPTFSSFTIAPRSGRSGILSSCLDLHSLTPLWKGESRSDSGPVEQAGLVAISSFATSHPMRELRLCMTDWQAVPTQSDDSTRG